jgi:hypothetical protein
MRYRINELLQKKFCSLFLTTFCVLVIFGCSGGGSNSSAAGSSTAAG